MSDKLFLLKDNKALVSMGASTFPSEDVFQEMLERFPELLADLDYDAASSRRWILVKREAGITDRKDGASRWSLDHLFLDQDGVPTLVEIKRASDSRARRDVVAQMLDYAANSVQWWKVEDLSRWFVETCEKNGVNPLERLTELLQTDAADGEDFWKTVQANLRSGRIRLLFVADQIAPELQRIVEFLNEQMNPATVLALELRPFSSGGDTILAPRVIGATTRAEAQKAVSPSTPAVSVDDLLSKLFALDGIKSAPIRKILEITKSLGAKLQAAGQSVAVAVDTSKGPLNVLYLRPYGSVALSGWMLRKVTGLENEQARLHLFEKLEAGGLKLQHKMVNGEPNIQFPKLDDEQEWLRVSNAMGQLFTQLKNANGV